MLCGDNKSDMLHKISSQCHFYVFDFEIRNEDRTKILFDMSKKCLVFFPFFFFLFIDENRCVTIEVFAISHHITLKDTADMIA